MKFDKNQRINEQNKMNNGIIATIIYYENNKDLTIKWEDDNSIQKIKSYAHFKDGKIAKTSDTPNAKKNKRIGETIKQNCGLNATIIEYFNSHNITIKFEDDEIFKKKYYSDFKKGLIKHPNLKNSDYAKKKLSNDELNYFSKKQGEVKRKKHKDININKKIKNKNGQMMEIIEYHSYDNISVKFDDGTIVHNQRLDQFRERRIVNPNNKIPSGTSFNEFTMLFYLRKLNFEHFNPGTLKDIGLEKYSIDAYNKDLKIAIEYDGEVHSFRRNTDIKKDLKCKELGITLIRIREKMEESSENAICYKLNNQKHFSKEFEECLKTLINYLHKEYYLDNININFEKDKEEIIFLYENNYITPHLGEEYINNKNEKAKIIRYIGTNEVYIEFEDGHIKKTSMSALRRKSFSRYNRVDYIKIKKEERIGLKKTMKCGMDAEIIDYRGCKEIDIKFIDGTIVKNQRYENFENGNIQNPNLKNK